SSRCCAWRMRCSSTSTWRVTSLAKAALVGNGERSVAWFRNMLEGSHVEGIRSAPASGLILTRVEYDGIDFVEDTYAKKRAQQRIKEALAHSGVMMQVLKRFDERMTGTL
ncbi:MAG: hypothetical protein ACXV2B_06925, partial [Halobacteriota archaeon]